MASIERNLTTGRQILARPSSSNSGLRLGGRTDLSFDYKKFKEVTESCEAKEKQKQNN